MTMHPYSAQLGPSSRAESWRELTERELDVLVIGGGVTGAGTALDAVTRGLRTGLVEARDFASGTSSRSSKLFHGGLRYLEQLNFALVAEALKERELMMTRIAPHLVHPVAFLYPLSHRAWERPYVATGIAMYDQMGGARSVPRQKHLTKSGTMKITNTVSIALMPATTTPMARPHSLRCRIRMPVMSWTMPASSQSQPQVPMSIP